MQIELMDADMVEYAIDLVHELDRTYGLPPKRTLSQASLALHENPPFLVALLCYICRCASGFKRCTVSRHPPVQRLIGLGVMWLQRDVPGLTRAAVPVLAHPGWQVGLKVTALCALA